MCGRYASSARPEDLAEEFDVEDDRTGERLRSILTAPQTPPAGEPDYNLAPTKAAPVVLTRAARGEPESEPRRQLRLLTWGLVPGWAKDLKVGLRLINARSEELLGKPSFARAAASRRCLVPADGWYEWQVSPTALGPRGKPRKQPFFVRRTDGAPMAMAGLYEFWRDRSLAEDDPDGWLTTYCIITTAAEPGLDRIHDRQPLVLERGDWADWLDPRQSDPARVKAHLEFAAPGRFDAYPVSAEVGSSRNNGAHLLEPLVRSDLVGVVDPTTGEIIGE
jgi:putative SOS response-associated peptidase YedK